MSRVSEELDITPPTIQRWSRADYVCKAGCQWHGWEELLRHETKRDLATLDIAPPEPPPPPALLPVPGAVISEIEATQDAIRSISKSDIERLCDLEYLYSMIYYDLTNLPVKCKALRDSEGKSRPDPEVEQIYQMGKKAQSLEAGIRSLSLVMDRIAAIRRTAGLDSAVPTPLSGAPSSDQSSEKMSLEEAREMMKQIKDIPPEKLHLIQQFLNKSKDSES